MKRCDKTTADPSKHAGPFTKVDYDFAEREPVAVATCAACGNSVMRPLKKGEEMKLKNTTVTRL